MTAKLVSPHHCFLDISHNTGMTNIPKSFSYLLQTVEFIRD